MAAEVLQLIPTLLVTRFRNKTILEICAMGGLTLEDFSQSKAYQEIFGLGEAREEARGEAREAAKVALRQLNRRCGPLSEATHRPHSGAAAGATGGHGRRRSLLRRRGAARFQRP